VYNHTTTSEMITILKQKKWRFAVAILLVGGFLGYLAAKTEDGRFLSVFLFECIGRWDLAMEQCQSMANQHQSSTSLEEEKAYTLLLARIGMLHTKMNEYDEALQIYENQLIPRLKEEDSDSYEDSLELLVLNEMVTLYKTKGEYQKGLDCLKKARRLLVSGHSNILTTLYLYDNSERTKDMEYLVDTLKDQEGYILALMAAARRYHFSTRSYDADVTATIDCPRKDKKHRFPEVPDIVLYASIGLVLWYSIRVFWSTPRQHLGKRGIVVCACAIPVFIFVWTGFMWNNSSELERLTFAAATMFRIGEYERALQLFDGARCEILANPYEEFVLTRETGFEVFTGALWVYNDLQLNALVDELSETIDELIEANVVLGASVHVASYYSLLSNVYYNRDEHQEAKRYEAMAQSEWDKVINNILVPPTEAAKKSDGNKTQNQKDGLDRNNYEL